MGGPVTDPSSRRSSSGSACLVARPRTTPGPRRCTPPAGRNSSTPRPGTTADVWRLSAEIFPRRSPVSTTHGIVTTRSARPTSTWSSIAARPCWPPGWPKKQRKRPMAALSRLPPKGGIAYKKAEVLFAAATAALAAGRPADAREHAAGPAGCSGRRIDSTGRRVLASSSPRPGTPPASIPWPCCGTPSRSPPPRRDPGRRDDAGAPARRAHRTEPGERETADPHLEHAAQSRRGGPPLPRSVAWLARALQADAQGNAQGHRRGLRPWSRRPRGAPDAARCHRVARVRHGPRSRARDAGSARRASTWRRPPAAVLERAVAGDRAGRPEHTAPWRQGANGRARSPAQRRAGCSGIPR